MNKPARVPLMARALLTFGLVSFREFLDERFARQDAQRELDKMTNRYNGLVKSLNKAIDDANG